MRYPKYAGRLAAGAVGAFVAGLSSVSPAKADVDITPTYIGMTPQDVGVMDRSRPEYDAKGIPVGSFRLFPSLDLVGNYDDNVFREPSGKSDYFFVIAPALRLDSEWGRHAVELYATMTDYEYLKYNSEGLTDWNVGGKGRLDVSHATTVFTEVSYGEYHEPWFTPNVVGSQARPNRYYLFHSDLEGSFQPSRLGIGFGGSYDHYDWTPTPIIGSAPRPNTDRNMGELQGYGRIFYDFSPGYSAFVKVTYDQRHFDQLRDASLQFRSSHGYRLDGGLDLKITHLVSGEVYAGYLSQSFLQSTTNPLPNVSGLDFGARLDWYLSPVLTLHLEGSRELEDVILAGVSMADNRSVSLSADYELRRNIILRGRLFIQESRYPGSNRKDTSPGASVGMVYLLNRHFSANLNYSFSHRSTNLSYFKYTDNMVSAGLTLHL